MLRTITAVAFLACTLSACATTKPEADTMRTIAAGTSTSMAQGETVGLPDGGTLKYVSVPQDSRCPPNVQCIRAGDADIEFAFAAAGGTASTVTPNLPEAPTKDIGAWKLTVEQLAFGDAPAVTVRIDK